LQKEVSTSDQAGDKKFKGFKEKLVNSGLNKREITNIPMLT